MKSDEHREFADALKVGEQLNLMYNAASAEMTAAGAALAAELGRSAQMVGCGATPLHIQNDVIRTMVGKSSAFAAQIRAITYDMHRRLDAVDKARMGDDDGGA